MTARRLPDFGEIADMISLTASSCGLPRRDVACNVSTVGPEERIMWAGSLDGELILAGGVFHLV
jgi:hypothetical protein